MNHSVKKIVFSFQGKLSRSEYFLSTLFVWLSYYVLYSCIWYIISDNMTIILSPFLLWALFAISTKRLHDLWRSGKFLFLVLIPVLGFVYLFIILFFKKSSIINNRYIEWNKVEWDYLKNPSACKIEWLDGDERIVNEVTGLHPVLVSKVETPTSIQDVLHVLKNTAWPISVWGGRFSMWGQTASYNSTHLDMRGMNQVVDFNKKEKTIKVQSWMRWCDIQKYIDVHNLSISIMQTYANFTVWGSLSVNVHGRYIWLGPLILSVRSIDIILADGTLKHASRTKNKEIFFGAIGWYNALWVIAQAELELEKNVAVKRVNKKMPTSEYKDYFIKYIRSKKKSIFHNWDMYPPHYKSINAVTWEKTNEKPTTKTRLMSWWKDYSLEKIFFWIFSELPFWKWFREYMVDPLLFAGKKVHMRNYEAWYDVADLEPNSRKKSTYVLLEYFVPIDRFEEFTNVMAEIYKRHNVNIINVSMRHAHPDTESYMSWAREEVFAFVVYYKQATSEVEKNKVAVWTRELEDAVIAVNGAYYLPYQAHATSEQFHKAYPWAKKLFKLKSKLDPDFRFRNIIWDTYYKTDTLVEAISTSKETSEFKEVFLDTYWSDRFYLFLQNIYHIYPEDSFHYLISQSTKKCNTDEEIYKNISGKLGTIKPFLSDVTYGLPALKKQKQEMITQSKQLLGADFRADSYVEIGSTGRYVNDFKKTFHIHWDIFTMNDVSPDNSLAEIFERWQVSQVSKHLDFIGFKNEIKKESIDLISCFIGLHHVPVEKLEWFIKGISDLLKPGGKFILRDHNADTKEMVVFCSLLHSVFNLGLWVSYEEDKKEYRNFQPLTYWIKVLSKNGLVDSWERLLQHKDPSKNTLIIFTKK